jgi:hypothetical protein
VHERASVGAPRRRHGQDRLGDRVAGDARGRGRDPPQRRGDQVGRVDVTAPDGDPPGRGVLFRVGHVVVRPGLGAPLRLDSGDDLTVVGVHEHPAGQRGCAVDEHRPWRASR